MLDRVAQWMATYLSRIVLALVLALAAVWVFNDFRQRDLAAEQRALEHRAFELTARAVMPGSALACLDAVFQIDDYDLELLVAVLFGDGLERVLQADSGSHHYGELVCKIEDVLPARSELEPETFDFLPAAFR